MGRDINILAIPFITDIDIAQCPQRVNHGHRRLFCPGDSSAFQIIKTVCDVVFDRFAFADRAPTKNQKMPFAQSIQLVLEQI